MGRHQADPEADEAAKIAGDEEHAELQSGLAEARDAEATDLVAEQLPPEGMPAPEEDPSVLELRSRASELRGLFLERARTASNALEEAKAEVKKRHATLQAICVAALENGVDAREVETAAGYSRGTLQQWAREAKPI